MIRMMEIGGAGAYSDDSYWGKGKDIGRVGFAQKDTVLSVKLRVQAQFGSPVSRVIMNYDDPRKDHEICIGSCEIFVS